ncbi:MAG: methylated-DNA--[protein]-cysteine S-methyltransferase, partial [Bacteroidota bacterium]
FTTLNYAKEQLTGGASTLATAHEVGLSGGGRLHDLFVHLEGMSPGEWRQRAAGATIRYQVFPSPFGPALVAATSRGICRLEFLEEVTKPEELLLQEFPNAIFLNESGPQLEKVANFLRGFLPSPSDRIRICTKGTPFQLNVWRALLQIPEGSLRTYSALAQAVGKPKAVRAVGTAIGKNPIALLIPCHRVIRTSGALGGYRWGVTRKCIINSIEASKRL